MCSHLQLRILGNLVGFLAITFKSDLELSLTSHASKHQFYRFSFNIQRSAAVFLLVYFTTECCTPWNESDVQNIRRSIICHINMV